MINTPRLIRQARKALRNTGDPEQAYQIVANQFEQEHKGISLLDFERAKQKINEDTQNGH